MSDKPFVLVIDDSVFCHLLHSVTESSSIPSEHYRSVIKAQVVWLQSGVWLPPEYINRQFKSLSVYDSKPYWRSEYLTRPEVVSKVPRKPKQLTKKQQHLQDLLVRISTSNESDKLGLDAMEIERDILTEELAIAYKAGRKFPEYSFTKLKKHIHEVTEELGYSTLGVPGYEADDLAALACKVFNSRGIDVLLLTVDTDWLGLLSHSVGWYCMKGYTPRLRTVVEDESGVSSFNQWALKKFGLSFSDPTDLWKYKAIHGDKSDNLPPGSPIEVIDLYEPPAKHRLWQDKFYYEQLLIEVNRSSIKPSVESARAAKSYLRKLGVPVAVSSNSNNSMVDVEYP